MKGSILSEVYLGVWCITKEYADAHFHSLVNVINNNTGNTSESDKNTLQFAVAKNGAYWISEQGYNIAPEDAPEDSVAIINVLDVITKYDQTCGPAGMKTKADLLSRCAKNANIKAVVLNIDSGGGSGNAMRLLAEAITNTRQEFNKPVIAFIDDCACSAAYGIASACDVIIANSDLAIVGSIGSYFSIVDYTAQLAMVGIKLIDVYADDSKDKNQDYIQAIAGDTSLLKEKINTFNDSFLKMIAENRDGKISKDKKEWGSGKTFTAKEALDMGLIDGIGSIEATINSIY